MEGKGGVLIRCILSDTYCIIPNSDELKVGSKIFQDSAPRKVLAFITKFELDACRQFNCW